MFKFKATTENILISIQQIKGNKAPLIGGESSPNIRGQQANVSPINTLQPSLLTPATSIFNKNNLPINSQQPSVLVPSTTMINTSQPSVLTPPATSIFNKYNVAVNSPQPLHISSQPKSSLTINSSPPIIYHPPTTIFNKDNLSINPPPASIPPPTAIPPLLWKEFKQFIAVKYQPNTEKFTSNSN